MDKPVHSWSFRLRRLLNWLPMGLAYAFLYMGRYNLTVAKSALGDAIMSKAQFGNIFAVGAVVYGVSFLLNGPLTDRLGGRFTMLLGVFGALVMNLLMGVSLYGIVNWGWDLPIITTFTVLYALNMYFQSFGAVSIVTVKAPWFHVRERGTFSTIFGIIITLGIYFAFDWGFAVVAATRATVGENLSWVARIVRFVFGTGGAGVDQNWWLFVVPAIMLGIFWVIMFLWLRNTPGEAGFTDFETGEDTLSADGGREPVLLVFRKIVTHPVLIVVCGIEFVSGVMRNGVMHWFPLFAKEVAGYGDLFVTKNWGLTLLIVGVVGAWLCGYMSDKVFQSRRAPMAFILYGLMFVSVVVMALSFNANPWFLTLAVCSISMSVIGVHGILSGTATADFAGTRNTGAAVGIVDGAVYLGTGLQSMVIGHITPVGEAAKVAGNWIYWPLFLIPFSLVGFALAWRIRHALPTKAR